MVIEHNRFWTKGKIFGLKDGNRWMNDQITSSEFIEIKQQARDASYACCSIIIIYFLLRGRPGIVPTRYLLKDVWLMPK